MGSDELRKEISKLDMTERLLLLEDLWDDIAASNDSVPLYDWQKTELDKRLESYHKGELKTFAWEEIHESLKNKYK